LKELVEKLPCFGIIEVGECRFGAVLHPSIVGRHQRETTLGVLRSSSGSRAACKQLTTISRPESAGLIWLNRCQNQNSLILSVNEAL
jgi:hypothetical protein